MVVKYCEYCNGKPYTTDLQLSVCPRCGKVLRIESADEIELDDRPQIMGEPKKPDTDSFFPESPAQEGSASDYQADEENLDVSYPNLPVTQRNPNSSAFYTSVHSSDDFAPDNCIRGRVAQYSSSGREDGEYRRLLPVKIYQAIVYRQRLEDVLHRFTVRVEQGVDSLGYQKYTDVPVNVHGTIAGGLQIVDNAEVEVHGRYKNGVLMADRINIINNGYKSKVGFQRSVKAITYSILSVIMLMFICFVAIKSNGSFFNNLKEFCIVWLIIAAILTVLYLITSLTKIGLLARMFSTRKRSFPLFGILLVSLALAFLFVSAFGSLAGFGSYLSGWIYSIVPIIIIVIAIFFMIKSVF